MRGAHICEYLYNFLISSTREMMYLAQDDGAQESVNTELYRPVWHLQSSRYRYTLECPHIGYTYVASLKF